MYRIWLRDFVYMCVHRNRFSFVCQYIAIRFIAQFFFFIYYYKCGMFIQKRDIHSHRFIVSHSCPLNFNLFYHSHSYVCAHAQVTRKPNDVVLLSKSHKICGVRVVNTDASNVSHTREPYRMYVSDLYVCSLASNDRSSIGYSKGEIV